MDSSIPSSFSFFFFFNDTATTEIYTSVHTLSLHDPLPISFPKMGVTGAALATTIGRGTGVLYQIYRLTRGDARVAVRRLHLALKPAIMASLIRLSGSGTFQVL